MGPPLFQEDSGSVKRQTSGARFEHAVERDAGPVFYMVLNFDAVDDTAFEKIFEAPHKFVICGHDRPSLLVRLLTRYRARDLLFDYAANMAPATTVAG